MRPQNRFLIGSGVVVIRLLVLDGRLDGELLNHGRLVGLDSRQGDESAPLQELLLGAGVQRAGHGLEEGLRVRNARVKAALGDGDGRQQLAPELFDVGDLGRSGTGTLRVRAGH